MQQQTLYANESPRRVPFLRAVAEDIQQRFGDDLSETAIVFNNKRPITYLKKHLADLFGRSIWSPQFFTIQEFMALSTSAETISPMAQFFQLYEIHNELLQQEGVAPETLVEFYPIAEIILSDFAQIDYDLAPVDLIFMELHDTSRIDIEFQHLTQEQQDFIRQFWQSFSLSGHRGIQQRFLRLWKRLPLLYAAFKEQLRAHGQTNFSTMYRDLAEGRAEHPHFAQRFKKVLFVGFNALSKAEEVLFKKWQEEGLALFYFDADGYYLDDKQQEAGLFIRRNIQQTGLQNALGECPMVIGKRTDQVHVYACTGRMSQAKLLHEVLLQNRQTDKSTAILLADESLLLPLLQSLPDIKVNITTGFPLLQSPLYGLLDLWMNVQEDISHFNKKKVAREHVEAFIHHPFIKLAAPEKAAIQTYILEKQTLEIPLDEIRVASSVLPRFFVPARPGDLLPALQQLLDQLLVALQLEPQIKQIDANLLLETKKVLHQLQLGFAKMQALSVLFQIGLIRKAIAPINSAIEGDPLDGVQIMGLLESRCLHFDQVYILGANEGVLPPTSGMTSFLPNNLRKAYGLPIRENQDALSAYLFYRHFQYSQGIHLFYNTLVDETGSGEESRFIRQLEYESNLQITRYTQQQPLLFPPPPEELIVPKTGKIAESMYRTFVEQKRRISATALTTYLQSPLLFFLKYVAGIKEPQTISAEFELNRLGLVIHEVMEKIFAPYKGKDQFVSTHSLAPILKEVPALVATEIGILYHSTIQSVDELNSMQRIMHTIACKYVETFLQHDIDTYEAFKIIELENVDDYFVDFPITINGRSETVRLYGIIDRVDEVLTTEGEVKTRIVDYKTGSDSNRYSNLDQVFAANTANKALLQTLFYTYVYEQVTGRNDIEPHLYVARQMRDDGTIFGSNKSVMEGAFLAEQKDRFVDFLRATLEEIFDPTIPFRHHPEMKVYDSDPYRLFYKQEISLDEENNSSDD